MNIKDKAEELVNEYMNIKNIKLSDYSRIYLPTAKQCAIIAIEQVLKYSKAHGFIGLTEEYQQIKNEIEKL
jgi:hypothetical protein